MLIHNQVSVSVGGSEIACEDDIALTLRDAPKTFPAVSPVFWLSSDSIERSHGICDTLRERCQLDGSHEHLFLLLYFNRVIEKLKSKAFLKDVLLPLPKAQLSLADDILPSRWILRSGRATGSLRCLFTKAHSIYTADRPNPSSKSGDSTSSALLRTNSRRAG